MTTEKQINQTVAVREAATDETAMAEPILAETIQPRKTPAEPRRDLAQSRFYRTIWRWHFYAGMVTLPVLIIASITGALYVFKDELEPVLYPKLMIVEPQAARVSYQTQIGAAQTAAPNATIYGLTASLHADHSTRVWMGEGENYYTLFVNPYTGEVLGEQHRPFFDIVLDLHRTLLAGGIGRIIVELATSWGIVLIITGLYLWLPRRRNKFWGVWLPRLRTKSYTVWRDLHTVGSFYLAIFTFLILLTGLAFSFVVGQSFFFYNLQTGGIPKSIFDPPKAAAPADRRNSKISPDEALQIAREHQNEGDHIDLSLPQDADGIYGITSGSHDVPSTFVGVYIDPYTGAKLDVADWKQFSVGAKTLLYSYPIHVGSIYGMPTKILAFIVCLLLVFASVSGAAMWWIRRPKGKLGAPKEVKEYKNPKIIVLTIIVFGVLMPTVGASLVVILLCDWVWRKLPRQRGQVS